MTNYILIWKGYNWRNLFNFSKYELMYFATEVVTLSRYVHVAILHKKVDGWYLHQAVASGVEDSKTDLRWIKEQVEKEHIEIYTISEQYKREILDDYMAQPITGIKYNFIGLFHQFMYNIFGKSIPNSDLSKRAFCSELVAYALKLYYPMSWSPQDIADLHFLIHDEIKEK